MDSARRSLPHVLFDESHSEAWTIRPEMAAAMQPSHPADASYAAAAARLAAREFTVAAHAEGPLTPAVLAGADLLVIAHPSEARWERTVPGGSPLLSDAELDAVEAWVRAGGGLILMAETEQEKYGANTPQLAARFGIGIANDTVQDYERHHGGAPSWVLADLPEAGRGLKSDLLARVARACFYRATTLEVPPGARVIARTSPGASAPRAPLAAAVEAGAGRVVVFADSDLFGDDCLDELDHAALWENACYWAAGAAFARSDDPAPSPAESDPHWAALHDAVEVLRAEQDATGAVTGDRAVASAQVDRMVAAVSGLAPHFPHQADYLEATVGDLRAWAAGGLGVPDFGRALDAFRPDRHREDGIEHLVVFPMYKQNGPREKLFEALIIRTPWPEWLARLEAERYDNPKFVPVCFVAHTSGYDSESAVLFPETVSTATRPVNHFGAIFCDREAARFRRVVASAAELLKLNLPPDAAALLASPGLSREVYMLWDLVHDRAHSHGDLPFDPFMIRQRAPYWMYSLEELRCDLTAFGEAMALEAEGLALGRHVQYAILFDRLFRFPITGERVRNYDGLGGQLLFAWLHKRGELHWTDNRLTIEWDRVAAGVAALRGEVEELYKSGIDRTKLQHWAAAHDLVAAYVPAAAGSKWERRVRAFADVEDPRSYCDEVLPDEFPLSLFYSSLKAKLAPPVAVAA
jgi:uncharacterized protein DUF6421/uncharacterized protein DUF4350